VNARDELGCVRALGVALARRTCVNGNRRRARAVAGREKRETLFELGMELSKLLELLLRLGELRFVQLSKLLRGDRSRA
jgi:hypothetical protein